MRILQLIAGVLLLVAFSFIFAPPSSAMTLPQLFHLDGLTIEQPLTFSSTTQLDKTRLFFGEIEEITIKKSTATETLAETIVSPTPIKQLLVAQVIPVAEAEEREEEEESAATPIPTQAVTPTPTQTPEPTTQLASSGGLDAEKLFSMSNAFRQARGLPSFQKDDRSCQLATSRAPEINAEIAEGRMHSGLRARNLPYWNSENIISMRNEEEAFNWWVNDKIHHDAIVGNYAYSCVACHGNACAQEFTNFQPK